MKAVLVALAVILLTATQSQAGPGSSWRAAGRSWRNSGSQLFDAIGKSIGDDANKKQEWREVGQDFKQAGKNTAGAVGDTLTPDDKGSSKTK